MSSMRISIVFRALNEEKWFADALQACVDQDTDGFEVEIVLVDSGSTDRTIEIAESFGVRIVYIQKHEFTFGRSLNLGCEAASGDILVFISAHCVPAHSRWLINLVSPLVNQSISYSYGRQIGHDVSRFSEHQIFEQYFPDHDKIPQDNFFVNNANSAIVKSVWESYKFDEEVTGLEDMVLAKAIMKDGGRIGYVADAAVYHIHEESFGQTKKRYYREALTLREIMPEVQLHFGDFIRYVAAAISHDTRKALRSRQFRLIPEAVLFRIMQYWGAYRGHNEHRVLSRAQKEDYYYPRSAHKEDQRSYATLSQVEKSTAD